MNSLIPESLRLFADDCGKSFLGFPHWYKYLPTRGDCSPGLTGINDIWLILLAIIEILLRVAILAAIIYVIIGGFKYITSTGTPEKTAQAKTTIQDALIGLIIAVIASAVVAFVARSFTE